MSKSSIISLSQISSHGPWIWMPPVYGFLVPYLVLALRYLFYHSHKISAPRLMSSYYHYTYRHIDFQYFILSRSQELTFQHSQYQYILSYCLIYHLIQFVCKLVYLSCYNFVFHFTLRTPANTTFIYLCYIINRKPCTFV